MKGTDILKTLPEEAGFKRDELIYDFVRKGAYVPITWKPLHLEAGGHKTIVFVSSDALRLGDDVDSFRPELSAFWSQRVADHLNATLLTPKLVDEVWRQADIRVDPPITLGGSPLMGTKSWMISYNAKVDERVVEEAAKEFSTEVDVADLLVANVGKFWVSSTWLSQTPTPMVDGLPAAANYGWFVGAKFIQPGSLPSKQRSVTLIPGVGIWQAEGHRHNLAHSDYSQVLMLVSRQVFVCGPKGAVAGLGYGDIPDCTPGKACKLPDGSEGSWRCVDIYDLGKDPVLAPLINHQGVLSMRQPGVPFIAPKGCLPPAGVSTAVYKGATMPVAKAASCVIPQAPPEPPYVPPHSDASLVVRGDTSGFGRAAALALGSATGYFGTRWIAKKIWPR